MNLFWLSTDPRIAAQYHVDRHVVKMILEAAQLACSALWESGVVDLDGNPSDDAPPYKLTHRNHPCAVWTRESVENYQWVVEYLAALAEEYTFRYGKTHKTAQYIEWFRARRPNVGSLGLTVPPCAMPDVYKISTESPTFNSVVESYWWYYALGKQHLHSWKHREPPEMLAVYLL